MKRLVCLLTLASCRVVQSHPGREVSFEEKLLATVPQGVSVDELSITFSPTGQTAAYVAKVNGWNTSVVVGDKRGPDFDTVWFRIVFSPDGKTLAYQASQSFKDFVVLGEKRSEAFDGVSEVAFGPNGHLGYIANIGWMDWPIPAEGRNFVVVDGKKGARFDHVCDLVFSPDGQTFCYAAQEGKRGFLVIGTRGEKAYDCVRGPIFVPNGKVAYRASKNLWKSLDSLHLGEERWLVVIGDLEGPEFDEILDLAFNLKGSSFAYAAKEGEKWFLVKDHKKGEPFDVVRQPTFSPDGKILAYVAGRERKQFMILEGRSGPEFDEVGPPVFSPDGESLAYSAGSGGTWNSATQKWEGRKRFVVAGEKKGDEFDDVGSPIFSPDGRSVIYRATNAGKSFVVAGDKKSEDFDRVDNLVVSPQGDRVAFGAVRGRELWWKVVEVK